MKKWERAKNSILALLLVTLVVQIVIMFNSADAGGGQSYSFLGQLFANLHKSPPDGLFEYHADGALSELPSSVLIGDAGGYFGLVQDRAAATPVEEPLRKCFAELFASAGSPEKITAADFDASFEGYIVYLTYLHELPLSLIAADSGSGEKSLKVSVTRLLICGLQDDACLLVQDKKGNTYRIKTTLPLASVKKHFAPIQRNNASLSERHDVLPSLGRLPFNLLQIPSMMAEPERQEELVSQLVSAYNFDAARVKNPYKTDEAMMVLVDESGVVTVFNDGTVNYKKGGRQDGMSIAAPGETTLSVPRLINLARTLSLQNIVGMYGDGRLYVETIDIDGLNAIVSFGLEVDGLPVYRLGGKARFATVEVRDGIIYEVNLLTGRYVRSTEKTQLLPVKLALEATGGQPVRMVYKETESGGILPEIVQVLPLKEV